MMSGLLDEKNRSPDNNSAQRDNLRRSQSPDQSAAIVPAQRFHPESQQTVKDHIQPKNLPVRFLFPEKKKPQDPGDAQCAERLVQLNGMKLHAQWGQRG